jgi:hypothetical protein
VSEIRGARDREGILEQLCISSTATPTA